MGMRCVYAQTSTVTVRRTKTATRFGANLSDGAFAEQKETVGRQAAAGRIVEGAELGELVIACTKVGRARIQAPAAIWRSARSKTSAGWPPEIK